LRETLVVHRRHDVSVEKIKLFDDPKHKEGKHCDGEKDRHAEAVHESDVHSAQNGRVLVVHVVKGSLVDGDVALNRSAFGCSSLVSATAAVEASEKDA